MAFLSALPSGGVCAVFTDAQLAKTSEATSNTVVTWSFMTFLNAKFRGRSQSLWTARTDSDSTGPLTITDADRSKERSDGIPFMRRMDLVDPTSPIESAAGSLPEGLAVRH
jgi:hypothetical protein